MSNNSFMQRYAHISLSGSVETTKHTPVQGRSYNIYGTANKKTRQSYIREVLEFISPAEYLKMWAAMELHKDEIYKLTILQYEGKPALNANDHHAVLALVDTIFKPWRADSGDGRSYLYSVHATAVIHEFLDAKVMEETDG